MGGGILGGAGGVGSGLSGTGQALLGIGAGSASGAASAAILGQDPLEGGALGASAVLLALGAGALTRRGEYNVRPTSGTALVDELSLQASALDHTDRGGQLTKAGRSLAKHGLDRRPGNSLFPSPKGSAFDINIQAQQVVEDIIGNPRTQITYGNRKDFGRTIEVLAPDGRGIVYRKSNQEFLFFREGNN